ncbi:MAG: FAD-dependent oxidoreductase [Candidatus Omnitrophica bacterium]|nr:FAD-dependent oxidoreductase [Candidatus Omnitrophota bacterium]MCM8816498.1 FAD-dependent oxidoreductase [Candidatus Omnitrophota bacterium]
MKRIKENARYLEIRNEYDVAVVGGGVAGAAAAISAARNNAKVCLIERYCAIGGLATLGNVNVYLPLCDGKGNKIITGIAEEFMKLSILDGYGKIPECWLNNNFEECKRVRLKVEFNPWTFAIELEKLLIDEGVEILYDTRFSDVIKEGNKITHLIFEDKKGRFAIKSKVVVDASGDADVCVCAGEKVVSVDTNVACGWFFCFDGEKVKRYVFSQKYDHFNRQVYDLNTGFSIEQTTQQILSSRENISKIIEKMKNENSRILPVSLPSIPTFRMTRRLKGLIELEESHEKTLFSDAVGMFGDWRKSGPVYYMPFSALYAVRTSNLITAGRCISACSAWDIIRAIPVCALTGEIAGTASALLCRSKSKRFSSLDIRKLQQTLKNQGVKVDEKI